MNGSEHDTPMANAVTDRFDNQTAIVTGSTRGIGEGIAKRLAAEGANVVVTGRTVESGEAVAEEIREETDGEATFVEADMRDPDDIAALVEATAEEYGSIDILVNNAGVQTETSADEATMDDWAFVVETDFRAYWLAAKYAVEHMPPGSTIINVSSNHSLLTTPGLFPYNAVKAGINGMTRAMALDLGPEIRTNTVAPGWIEIERTRGDIQDDAEYEHIESIHPVGRIGRPADIAGTVAFLASDDAAFITGSTVVVDGGRSAVMQDDTLPNYREQREEMESN
jgi:NAD(P)-dependent dehydrogenase (short-subunit alcohol dehydrogenase family)